MKIAFPCYKNPYFDSSASGNRNECIINGLINNGVQVKLVVTGGFNSFSEFKAKGYKLKNPNLEVTYPIFTFQSAMWLRRINTYLLSDLFYYLLSRKLKRLFRSSFDFLWLTGNLDLRKCYLKYRNSLKGKTIIELSEYQELSKDNSLRINLLQLKKQIDYTNVTMKVLNHVDYFVVITNTLIEYYKGLTKNKEAKFFHLPMIVDLKRFQNVQNSLKWQKPFVAFTGTYTNLKDGVDILIRAFGKIATKYPDYHLCLAGFYHQDMKIQENIITELGLEDRITYLGALEKNEIPEFICNSDLLVLSRPDSRQAHGGFPTKLGEYLATGRPVCVTKVGEIPNYLDDNISAFLAEPGSVNSFADAMDRALANKEESNQVGLEGKKVAETFFNDKMEISKLINFLRQNTKIN